MRDTALLFAVAVWTTLSAADLENLSFDPSHRHINNVGAVVVSFDLPAPSSVEEAYLEVRIGATGVTIPGSSVNSGFSRTDNMVTVAGSDLYALAGGAVSRAVTQPTPGDETLAGDDEAPDGDTLTTGDDSSLNDDTAFPDADIFDSEVPDTETLWPSSRDGQYQVTLVLLVDRDAVPDYDQDADAYDHDVVSDADVVVLAPRAVTAGNETREVFTVTLDNVPPAAPEAATVEGGNRKLVVTVTPSVKDLSGKSGEQIGAYHVTLSGLFEKGGVEEEAMLTYVKRLVESEWDDERHSFTLEGKNGYALVNNDANDSIHAYRIRIVAEDLAGNRDESAFFETTGSAQTTEGFWSHYKRVGGTEKGDYCFIASAAYGDRDHPFVRTLRAWRDAYLAPHEAGRAFVAWYYRTGPLLAGLMAEAPAARPLVQLFLFPFVVCAWLMLNPWFLAAAIIVPLAGMRRRGILVLLFVATALPGILAAGDSETITMDREVSEKEKERSVKESEKIDVHGDFLFAFGFYDPSSLDRKVAGNPIDEVLTSDINFLPAFHFGMDVPAGKHLKLTAHAGVGFVELRGRSLRLDGTAGAERSYFYILPVMGELKLRPVYEFPVRPYLAAGLDYYFWWIVEDRKLAEDGGKFGLHGTAGIQISLNFIDPKTAIKLREATGILDTALFAHYRLERVDNFFAKRGFDLSSSRFEFGIIFDY